MFQTNNQVYIHISYIVISKNKRSAERSRPQVLQHLRGGDHHGPVQSGMLRDD